MSVYTALITPFDENDNIDYISLKKLIDFQFVNNIDKIVIFGTTGEAPTITKKEKLKILEFIISKYYTKLDRFVIGFSGNNTKGLIDEMEDFESYPFKYYMLSAPYYNKPSQEGLYYHFSMIMSRFSEKSFMIYNIPGRTGVNILPETMRRICEDNKNYFGVKEASGDLNQISTLIKDIKVFSGDDGLANEIYKLGGVGVVSVASNLYPKEMRQCMLGEIMMDKIFELEFIESNPVPIKYMLMKSGLIKSEKVRLPLVELSIKSKKIIDNYFK